MSETATTIAALIANVERADSSESLLQATRDLAANPSEAAAETLIAILGYNNPGAAVAAVEGLIALGDAVVPALLDRLDGYDYGARAWAIRALSGIGNPRALDLLLEAASGDFALSVRRAAARGLGNIRWELLDAPLAPAQARTLSALKQVVCQDPEWVVRYAATVGLQGLSASQPDLGVEIRGCLQARLQAEPEAAARARIQLALAKLQVRSQ